MDVFQSARPQGLRPNTGLPPLNPPKHTAHIVKPGDSISKILQHHYRVCWDGESLKNAVSIVLQDNPEVRDANLIYPGQLLYIRSDLQDSRALDPYTLSDLADGKNFWKQEEKGATSVMAYFGGYDSVSGIMDFFDGATGQAHKTLERVKFDIDQIVSSYERYKLGQTTRHQHYSSRKQVLNALDRGADDFARKFYFGGQSATDHFKIRSVDGRIMTQEIRSSGRLTSQPMGQQIRRITKLGTLMKAGGIVLGAAGVAYSAHQICSAEPEDQIETLAVEGSSMAAASGAAMLVGAAIAGGPIGLTAILIVGAATVFGGFTGSLIGKVIYDELGRPYQVKERLGICKRLNYK